MFQDQYEYDLLGDGPRLLDTEAGITDSLSKLLQEKADEEALENGITDDEEEGEDACCEGDDAFDDVEGTFDDEDVGHPAPPVLNEEEEEVEVLEDDVLEEGDTVDIDDDDVQQGGAASEPEKELDQKKKKKKSSKKARAASTGPRLQELSKPRAPKEPSAEEFKPPPKPQKKQQGTRPSLLLRLRPTNLEESMQSFFSSGFTEDPRFTYAYSDEYVTKNFEENSNVCFELMPEAQRILQRVQDEYGGPEQYMQRLYGTEKISAEEMRDTVATYLQEHNVDDKVEIRIVDSALSAANVVKPGPNEKYIVNINHGPVSQNMVQGICDHEVGTHLLRMMNDEHQVWHGRRERYKLLDPWITEEGFATLNTYMSMPNKLMYPQALRYWAVCRGAQVGFAELFRELQVHVNDPKRCWQMCCRIKRGMIDTSQPGAFYKDQAYFKGAVEILRHLDEVDFGRLYGGQIALQDMDKVHFLLRKEIVRLPRFLNSVDKLKLYRTHCKKLIKENQIETAIDRVCKPVFVRAAREFFKTKTKQEVRSASVEVTTAGAQSSGLAKALDLSRLEEMAKPRQIQSESESPSIPAVRREVDRARMAGLAAPRARTESMEETATVSVSSRPVNLTRLQDLARPRQVSTDGEATDTHSDQRRSLDHARLLSLAVPRSRTTPEDAPSGRPPRPPRGASAPSGQWRKLTTKDIEFDAGSGNEDTSDTAVPPPPAVPEGSRRRHCSRSRASQKPPPEPPPQLPESEASRTLDMGRLCDLATPRKFCEDKQEPCNCKPKKRRRRSKLRLLAMVQDKKATKGEDEEGGDAGEDEGEKAAGDDQEGVDEEVHDEVNYAKKETKELLVHDAGTDEKMDKKETQELQTISVGEIKPTQKVPMSIDFQLGATGDKKETKKLQAQRPPPHYEPRPHPVVRARSLGAGKLGTLAAGPIQSNMFQALDLGERIANRPRVPVGLPRAAACSSDTGPAWKAVPIKIFELGM